MKPIEWKPISLTCACCSSPFSCWAPSRISRSSKMELFTRFPQTVMPYPLLNVLIHLLRLNRGVTTLRELWLYPSLTYFKSDLEALSFYSLGVGFIYLKGNLLYGKGKASELVDRNKRQVNPFRKGLCELVETNKEEKVTECETLYIPFNHDSEDSQVHREDSALHCMCWVVSSTPYCPGYTGVHLM